MTESFDTAAPATLARPIIPARLPAIVRAGSLGLTVIVFAALALFRPPPQLAAEFEIDSRRRSGTTTAPPRMHTQFITNRVTEFVHSATIADLGDGRLRAIWMGGTREGHPDVRLFSSVFEPQSSTWSPEREIMDIERLKHLLRRNIVTIGNPVAMMHEDGRLFLWFVSVSLGGWSGSAINLMISHDGGETWERPQRLITTPMFNLSTLVKSTPIRFTDGSIGLPVYHECFGKFGELLRMDEQGNVLHKQRLTWGRSTLQPHITPLSPTKAVALKRRAGDAPQRVIHISTDDGGRSWSDPEPLPMPNPSGPVSKVRLDTGELLICFNNQESGRGRLSLALSPDGGRTYEVIHELDDRDEEGRGVSYPTLVQTRGDEFHLVYTWYREHIKHVAFNRAWVEQQR